MSKCILAIFVLFLASGSGPVRTVPESQLSHEAADSLDRKIAQILTAEQAPQRSPEQQTSIIVTEAELESFVLYGMKDEIPPRVDSIDVDIEPGQIAALTELFFDSSISSGNPIVDLLLSGSHTMYLEGALEGRQGRGRFELQEVRVDGISVPLFLVDALIARYVTPQHPNVDLGEPFEIPWGIEEIVLNSGEASITY